jgi:hypothetical protein
MTDALAIAEDYEVDFENVVGANEFSYGHEAGQIFAASRIADLIRYHEVESPSVALLRQIRATEAGAAAADEIDALLARLAQRSEEGAATMTFVRAMLRAKEVAGNPTGVRRLGQDWLVFYDASITLGGREYGLVRQFDDGRVMPYFPDIGDIAATDWTQFDAPAPNRG